MTDDSDVLSAELEMTCAMYGEDAKVEQRADGTVVSVRLEPRSGGDELQRFMEVMVELRLPRDYPCSPACVKLPRSRGLVDEEEARLLAECTRCAAESAAAGEGTLFTLLESAVELVTQMNAGGTCPVCREPLFEKDEDESGALSPMVYLSQCYHSFHAGCLGGWWHAFEKPASKDTADAAPSKAAGQVMQARAAEATACDLRAKADACATSVADCTERLALLNALEEPPPAATVRKAEETLQAAMEEHHRLEARTSKARAQAECLAAEAAAAELAEQHAAAEEPLPCPICRAPMLPQHMAAAGVCRKPFAGSSSTPDAVCLNLTPAQRQQQDERRKLLAQREQRQTSETSSDDRATGQPSAASSPPQQHITPRSCVRRHGGQERRAAPDGNLYTKAEFHSFFGSYEEWDSASPTPEHLSVPSAPPAPATASSQANTSSRGAGSAPARPLDLPPSLPLALRAGLLPYAQADASQALPGSALAGASRPPEGRGRGGGRGHGASKVRGSSRRGRGAAGRDSA
mmetsp:Transcript_45413/g.119268  ORF Transcript_45413/g.119268 Transcript_45413/m.119268 type:complete len:520 (+) Transcript_45413:124-1683(+)|eukprot:CAMPEP_0115843672 /NCGR_PEP_ID=MMETSP0287-20121206/8434_1 /TAXON_ID=412157 /ORGANISM="Chrysochromulina rotalis, Strain UIO044" /LENGTH=519 /DNA_ID=CAMNT_0003297375 /DNA_START=109 /DNA_END=1668 /DNA_ORIENTATION=-